MTDTDTLTNGHASTGARDEVVPARFRSPRSGPRALRVGPGPRAASAILLADDRVHYLNALESILAPLDNEIFKVRTGEEARRHIVENDVAVVLLDVALPGLEGIGTTAAPVSPADESEELPIVVLTDFERPLTVHPGSRGLRAAHDLHAQAFADALRSKVTCLVALHGGSIELKSPGESQGTEFLVQLPRGRIIDPRGQARNPGPGAALAGAPHTESMSNR